MNEILAPVLNLLNRLGEMALFLFEGFRQAFRSRRLFGKVVQQIYVIGAKSMFVILLIGLFTGLVLGLQAFYAMSMFGAQGMLGSLLALTLIREMAPVLTAVMITARAGSAMTAEIGVMRISDQIDALEVMDINLASLVTFPLLTAIFTVVGIFGGYLSACVLLGLNEGRYFSGIESSVTMDDVQGCFLKALVFAVIVILICCFQGYNAHRRSDGKGAEAVGNATTSAVVMSCVLILMADYVLTSFLL